MTDTQWDKTLLARDAIFRMFDPPIPSGAVVMTRCRVAPEVGTGVADGDGNLWVVQVSIDPDTERRLFWFNKDCYVRNQAGIAKMDPANIRQRIVERAMERMRG